MDMSQVNAAIEGEKARAQTARIEAALTEILGTVRELKAEVATLRNEKRPGKTLQGLAEIVEKNEQLSKAKRLGEQTQE